VLLLNACLMFSFRLLTRSGNFWIQARIRGYCSGAAYSCQCCYAGLRRGKKPGVALWVVTW